MYEENLLNTQHIAFTTLGMTIVMDVLIWGVKKPGKDRILWYINCLHLIF